MDSFLSLSFSLQRSLLSLDNLGDAGHEATESVELLVELLPAVPLLRDALLREPVRRLRARIGVPRERVLESPAVSFTDRAKVR